MKIPFSSLKVIALNTFREAVRDRIFYALLLFALLMIMGSVLLGNLAIGGREKIVKDMGLGSISVFGMLIAVFTGIGLISKEIERRTIYTILAKPLSRSLFIFGKFLGLALVIFFEVLVMALGLLVLVFMIEGKIEFVLFKAVFLIYLELSVITAVAILFSCFSSSPALSGLFCLGIYVIGHLSADIKALGQQAGSIWLEITTKSIYYLLPNLEKFNIKSEVVLGTYVSWKYLSVSSLYAVFYMGIILILTMLIFKNRDFT